MLCSRCSRPRPVLSMFAQTLNRPQCCTSLLHYYVSSLQVGQRRGLQIINIMNNDGSLNDNAGRFAGMDRADARSAVWAALEVCTLELQHVLMWSCWNTTRWHAYLGLTGTEAASASGISCKVRICMFRSFQPQCRSFVLPHTGGGAGHQAGAAHQPCAALAARRRGCRAAGECCRPWTLGKACQCCCHVVRPCCFGQHLMLQDCVLISAAHRLV